MDIKALAAQTEEYIIARRRAFHAQPEISEHEENTRKMIRAELEALGITEITELTNCFGLTATIRGGHPGKTVALRSDTDALKIVEETGLPFASTNGNMHACGHDNHMAMLLGAAKMLMAMRDELHGNVKLIFQPAEEIAMGAKWMIEGHAIDDVDAIYGNHVWGNFDAPFVDVSAGDRMAGCDVFTIRVEGKGAHGSAPHLGHDAISASAAIVNALQQYVSRINDPLIPMVVTVGDIHGGSAYNVIANSVVMNGTVRSFLSDGSPERSMRRIIEATAKALGVTATLEYHYLTIPVANSDPLLNRVAHDAAVKVVGEEHIAHLPTMMGSEDFSWFGEKIPYFYSFIGTRNKDKGLIYTNHHEKFNVDESVLKNGAALMAQFAVDYLSATAEG